MIELTILMPCLNEADVLARSIEDARQLIKLIDKDCEILIIDNGSTDQSTIIAESLGCRVIKEKNRGYGNALRRGIQEAKGKYIILADCDGTYKFSESIIFYKLLDSGYDAVFGNRYKGIQTNNNWSFSHKYIGVPLLSFIGRKFYHCDIVDFHCGLMGFNTEFAKSLKLSSKGFEFSSEIIGKTCNITKNYIQVPVTLYYSNRINSKSHLHSIRDGLRHLNMIMFDRSE